jgi:hypothetical protein
MVHCERHICTQTVSGNVSRQVKSATELIGKATESLFGNCRKDSGTISEVVVRRLVAHSCASSYFSHRDGFGAFGGNDVEGTI